MNNFSNVQSSLGDSYHYADGCVNGDKHCKHGMKCGSGSSLCGGCSYEECENLARRSNHFAFSYLADTELAPSNEQGCRMCNQGEFKDRRNSGPNALWGIYVKGPREGSQSKTIKEISLLLP